MGLLDRIRDEQARLAKEEDRIDKEYAARKTAINARQRLLAIAENKVTPELDDLVEKLGVAL